MMKQAKILVADDDRAITDGLNAILSDDGFSVDVVGDGQKALDRLKDGAYGVVLADLMMPKLDGLGLLKAMQSRGLSTECIIITGKASVDSAVQAMREGAYDYIEKPLSAEKLNRLKALIAKALDKFDVKQANRALTSELEKLTHYGELTGQSEQMRRVYQVIDAVAPSTASVLIMGESGTGKELVARAIHAKSDRAKGPLFALNCAALPKDILENELFGHEKGAFTGSTNEKQGAFEMADGGTIFLDEIAEMPPDIQVKLLRALESRCVRRLGGKREIEVDIRVVAATNRDVQQALSDGDLREDLYYRLAVVELFLPPLRERIGDIKLLATEFLARFASQNDKKISGFDDTVWKWILSFHWPGNVRELKNAVERAVIMSTSDTITLDDIVQRHLRASAENAGSVTVNVGSTMAEASRQLLLTTFASTGGNQDRTAKILGMSPAAVRTEIASLIGAGKAGGGAASNGAGPALSKQSAAKGKAGRRQSPASRGGTEKPKAKRHR
ncbi:MAG: sigma-54-dependent transcriptional regulator [Gemmatimonadaceae bacterium]